MESAFVVPNHFLIAGTLVINLLAALVLILLSFVLAKALGFVVTVVLKTLQLDKLSQQIGFNNLLEKAEIKRTIAELLGDLVYWLVVFLALIMIVAFCGLKVDTILLKLLAYLGMVFVAAFVLALGLFLASFIAGLAKVIMVNLGIIGAKSAGRFIYYVVIAFTFLAVLAELGVKPKVFLDRMDVLIGAFGLAAAIAFGLGCKDMAADFLHNLFKGK